MRAEGLAGKKKRKASLAEPQRRAEMDTSNSRRTSQMNPDCPGNLYASESGQACEIKVISGPCGGFNEGGERVAKVGEASRERGKRRDLAQKISRQRVDQ